LKKQQKSEVEERNIGKPLRKLLKRFRHRYEHATVLV